jgi:signal transduction histidine kinase
MAMKYNSLAFRLFATAAAWTLVVLPMAGLLIYTLYRADTVNGHDRRLRLLLTVIRADSVEHGGDEPGAPKDSGETLFTVPQSGWYWQIKPVDIKPGRRLVSDSLGEDTYPLPSEIGIAPNDSEERWGIVPGPNNQILRVVEMMHIFGEGTEAKLYSISVAGTLAEVDRSLNSFSARLIQALSLAGVGLLFVTLFQVRFGLHPLRQVEKSLAAIRAGEATRLDGVLPAEIEPMQVELNALLKSNQDVVERARTQVGNLAHALKTPLAVLINEARDDDTPLAHKVTEQSQMMRDHITHYLNRARMAANVGIIGRSTEVRSVSDALSRTLQKIYRERGLELEVICPQDLRFRGERQDLEEMLGNLLDNACKWAHQRVRMEAKLLSDTLPDKSLEILVEDDGPGLSPEQLAEPVQRGRKLDETKPGSGLGHSIVAELAQANHGGFTRMPSPLGGLRTRLVLPAV